MSKKLNYKVVCPSLDTVLLVKRLKLSEEKLFYNSVKDRIKNSDTPINIESYMEYLIAELVIGAEDILSGFKGEDREEVVRAIYASLGQLYPMFQLEMVCDDLNHQILIRDMGTFFQSAVMEFVKSQKDMWDKSESEASPEEALEGSPPLSSLQDVERIEKYLKKNLIGQEAALEAVVNSLKLVAAGLTGFTSFFFIGPTGVGKTQLSRLLGKTYSGNFYKINCAEYSSGHEYSKLIGSPPGYIGHTESSILASKAEKSNKWVFVFDEIEKASDKFHDFLLSLLDDGTLTDNMGVTLDFTNSIFIFTSNQGVKDTKVGETTLGFGSHVMQYEESQEEILKSVKKEFSSEFLNRIDNFIFFNQLNKESIRKIVGLELKAVPVKKTNSLVSYITEKAYSTEYGARNIARFIKNNVAVKVADKILNKKVPTEKGALYTPRIIGGEFEIVKTKDYEDLDNGLDEKAQDASGG